MGARKKITSKTPFFERARIALDIPAEKLAEIMSIETEDAYKLCLGASLEFSDTEDEIYAALLEYVNERMGMCMALRTALSQELDKAARKRVAMRKRIFGT
jgi:hypothetical protein